MQIVECALSWLSSVMHWFDLNDRNVDDIRDAKGADSQPLPWFLFFSFLS